VVVVVVVVVVVEIPLDIDALEPSFRLTECLRPNGIRGFSEETYPAAIDAQHRSPFSWSLGKKTTVLFGTFFAATLAAYSAGAYAMAAAPLTEKWGLSSTEFNLGITLFVLGFGFAPMVLALVSETHGRYWLFVGSGAVFFLGTLGCAVAQSFAGMLVSRLVTGNGASVFATLTGGVVGDMITVGSTTLAIFFCFDETRSNVVLRRKCAALNNHLEGLRLLRLAPPRRGAAEGLSALLERDASLPSANHPQQQQQTVRVTFTARSDGPALDMSIIWRSFSFPLKLLFTESVVFWFSAWVSFAWAILYMQFNSVGLAFRSVYGFSSAQVGGAYAAVIVGSVIAAVVTIFQDPVFRRLMPRRMATPEGRLYSACAESLFLPVGLFWFAWSSSPDVPWVVPALAIASVTVGIFTVYLAVFNYLADTYHRHASSALAAQSMCRNLLAGVFPLFTNAMFQRLGYGVAGSLLGGIGLLLSLVPWLLCIYGERIRGRSPFAGQLKAG
ncbi:Efflux pump atB, partial [Colletotrichum shisoi]